MPLFSSIRNYIYVEDRLADRQVLSRKLFPRPDDYPDLADGLGYHAELDDCCGQKSESLKRIAFSLGKMYFMMALFIDFALTFLFFFL